MESKVFYSWQSDLPNSTNRGFIQTALESAVKSIRDDETIKIEPVIDRDTAGVPGAPDIADTILAKIEKSQLFVADVSIINNDEVARKVPNPNVLIEVGYAMKTLGLERIILVMNTIYGGPELLPFDLRMRRVITYEMLEQEKDRASERKKLSSILEEGIRAILTKFESEKVETKIESPLLEQAMTAVTTVNASQTYQVREYMKSLNNSLLEISPKISAEKTTIAPDDILVQALDETLDISVEFARLVEAIAAVNSQVSATTIFSGFNQIIERYHQDVAPPNHIAQPDFFKFIGHELFVIFISFLIREKRWDIISDILDEGFVLKPSYGKPENVSFAHISAYVGLLAARKKRLGSKQISLHADLLNNRHSTTKLSDICPMEQFVEADFFLYVKMGLNWKPWSTLYLYENTPQFVIQGVRLKYAEQLFRPLGVKDLDSLRVLLNERRREIFEMYSARGFWHSTLDSFDLSTIGSK